MRLVRLRMYFWGPHGHVTVESSRWVTGSFDSAGVLVRVTAGWRTCPGSPPHSRGCFAMGAELSSNTMPHFLDSKIELI